MLLVPHNEFPKLRLESMGEVDCAARPRTIHPVPECPPMAEDNHESDKKKWKFSLLAAS